MPQSLTLNIPFPANPVRDDLSEVRRAHLEWLHRYDLLPTEMLTERYVRSRVADIAAYCDPQSKNMLLSYNVYGWIFLHDDWIDSPDGDVDVHALNGELVSILNRPATPTCPLTAAFADLWNQVQAGMSETWRRRMAWLWQQCFYGNLAEAANRRGGRTLTSREHLRIKDMSATALVYGIAERTGGFEVPDDLWHASCLDTLRHHATRHITLVNEIHSFEQDEAGARPNLVSLAMQERKSTRAGALNYVAKIADRHIREMCGLELELDAFLDDMDLSPAMRDSVRKHVDTLHNWVRGSYEWYSTTCRYSVAT